MSAWLGSVGCVPATPQGGSIVFVKSYTAFPQQGGFHGCLIRPCPSGVPQGSSIVSVSSYTAFHAWAPIAMYAVSKDRTGSRRA